MGWEEQFKEELVKILINSGQEKDFNEGGRKRTNLILGECGSMRTEGIIYKVFNKIRGKRQQDIQIAFDRYIDCRVYGDNDCAWKDAWWQGKQFIEYIVEVENDINEFKGTVSDLLRTQAEKKIGIFYFSKKDLKEDLKGDPEEMIREVFNFFYNVKKFRESENTEYLIIFLPIKIDKDFLNNIKAFKFKLLRTGEDRIDLV